MLTLATALLLATSTQIGQGVVTDTQAFGNNAGFTCASPQETVKFRLWTREDNGERTLFIWCGESN